MKCRGMKFGLIGLLIFAAFSAVVMLLWNLLIPGIFGITAINFWQSAGLLLLSRLLFGGIGGGRKMWMGRGFERGGNPLREKWMNMSPEEREEFIKRRHFGRRCFDPRQAESNSSEKPSQSKTEGEE